jgi:hypothetical protein
MLRSGVAIYAAKWGLARSFVYGEFRAGKGFPPMIEKDEVGHLSCWQSFPYFSLTDRDFRRQTYFGLVCRGTRKVNDLRGTRYGKIYEHSHGSARAVLC